MSAKIQQVYKGDGVTLTVIVEATPERASRFLYEEFASVASAVEDFMADYPIVPEIDEPDVVSDVG